MQFVRTDEVLGDELIAGTGAREHAEVRDRSKTRCLNLLKVRNIQELKGPKGDLSRGLCLLSRTHRSFTFANDETAPRADQSLLRSTGGAIAAAQRAVQLAPNVEWSHAFLGMALTQDGRFAAALPSPWSEVTTTRVPVVPGSGSTAWKSRVDRSSSCVLATVDIGDYVN